MNEDSINFVLSFVLPCMRMYGGYIRTLNIYTHSVQDHATIAFYSQGPQHWTVKIRDVRCQLQPPPPPALFCLAELMKQSCLTMLLNLLQATHSMLRSAGMAIIVIQPTLALQQASSVMLLQCQAAPCRQRDLNKNKRLQKAISKDDCFMS
jgi:hypothetical protein